MLRLHTPTTFKLGDTISTVVDYKPTWVTWVSEHSLLIDGAHRRHVADWYDVGVSDKE